VVVVDRVRVHHGQPAPAESRILGDVRSAVDRGLDFVVDFVVDFGCCLPGGL
jgi:hypothetical protein